MDAIKIVENAFANENAKEHPSFGAGDTITVHYKIKEGSKERIQNFRGVVLQTKGAGSSKTFTVRKMSGNTGVERIFPIHSPKVDKIEVVRRGDVNRAKLYYLRERRGKAAQVKEKRH